MYPKHAQENGVKAGFQEKCQKNNPNQMTIRPPFPVPLAEPVPPPPPPPPAPKKPRKLLAGPPPPVPSSSASPPLNHFGLLKPLDWLGLVGLGCIHFGVSMVSRVFLTRLPNKVKKFSSSGSGSTSVLVRGAGRVDNGPPVPSFRDAAAVLSEGGTHRVGAAREGRLVSRDTRGDSLRPSVVDRLPCRSWLIRFLPSLHPPVPKPEGFSSSPSSSSRIPKPRTFLILP